MQQAILVSSAPPGAGTTEFDVALVGSKKKVIWQPHKSQHLGSLDILSCGAIDAMDGADFSPSLLRAHCTGQLPSKHKAPEAHTPVSLVTQPPAPSQETVGSLGAAEQGSSDCDDSDSTGSFSDVDHLGNPTEFKSSASSGGCSPCDTGDSDQPTECEPGDSTDGPDQAETDSDHVEGECPGDQDSSVTSASQNLSPDEAL